MNILCCFKIVSDLDNVVQRDWDTAQIPGPDLSYVRKLISCYDEAGLEAALRIRDSAEKSGESVTLSAVTLGSGSYDYFFHSLFALGFKRIVQVRLPDPVTFTPELVSHTIAHVFDGCPFDAVICGAQSADGSGGTTPYLLSKCLGLACLPNVIDMSYESGALRIRREIPGGESSTAINVPAVYAVGNSAHPYLRMATVRQRLAVSDLQPEFVDGLSLPLPNFQSVELVGFTSQKSGKGCEFVAGDSCVEKAKSLLSLCPEVKRA